MFFKILRKTIIPSQFLAYGLGLFVGSLIILFSIQLYLDLTPFVKENSTIFNKNAVIVSKNISLLDNINKNKIFFNDQQIKEFSEQDFVDDIAIFKNAKYKIKGFNNKSKNIPVYYTDLFFESIPDNYIDVDTEEWSWNEDSDFIPIIIPENYLNLYNFGFAQTQGLPLVTKNLISKVEFNINIRGNSKSKDFKARIINFSKKINTILVPESFLNWSNETYGSNISSDEISRLLIKFKDPSDKNILKFLNLNDYNIEDSDLAYSKFNLILHSSILIILIISIIIISLSIINMFLSLSFILQKNQSIILNLTYMGYSKNSIVNFYFTVTLLVTLLSNVISLTISNLAREYYIQLFSGYFEIITNNNLLYIFIILLLVLLISIYTRLKKSINKIVIQ